MQRSSVGSVDAVMEVFGDAVVVVISVLIREFFRVRLCMYEVKDVLERKKMLLQIVMVNVDRDGVH